MNKSISEKNKLIIYKNFFFIVDNNITDIRGKFMCKNILIVDDDSNFIWQMINNIKNRYCSIATANSIDRAENILDNNDFDFVVANVTVPGGNSMCLKDHSSPDTKFLFMSNFDSTVKTFYNSFSDKCYYKQDVTGILDRALVNV